MNKILRSKIIAIFFLVIIVPSTFPISPVYASNNGPNAPEASGFESVNATDMVNLSSGDMSYVLPLMDVGGMPISLSYHGGVPLDLESTWTGLGWNLNTGAINRGLNATPDDWNGGNSLDFIRYQDTETVYTVNVGVGIATAAEVGVGASWGSNKSLSGSVFASVSIGAVGASASIDTNGNYSLGVGGGLGFGAKDGGSSFGGGVSMSGNVSGGKTSFGAGVGVRTSGGMTAGLGASLDGGVSASLGYSNKSGSGNKQSGESRGGSVSVNSFSSGDWDISSKGWYVPISVGIFSFGFGKQKIASSLAKAYKKKGYGVLYSNLDNTSYDAVENDNGIDTQFADYQNRYRYMDAYEQTLPQTEEDFVADSDADREKINFSFAGYDSFDVNATGISGVLSPRILQNATVFGLGYKGNDPANSGGGKMRIYNHNTLVTDKTFGKNIANDIEFYFDGQFTQNKAIPNLTTLSNNNTTLEGILSSRQALDNQRLRQGNYVEVFTNAQIKNNQAQGLLSPMSPTTDGLTLAALNRNTNEYKNEGIGGYKITAPDGKVYHFSQPVYHFEQVERTILKDVSEDNVSEKRQYTSYATHWLLTAVTGPDFIDINNNNIADAADYGYWVRMDYGKWSDGFVWRNPTDKNLKDYNSNLEGDIGKNEFGTYQFGRKQLYYLDRIVSATHTAFFVKDLRYDSVGSDLTYKFNQSVEMSNDGTSTNTFVKGEIINPYEPNITYNRQMQLMLKKIILVKNENASISKGNTTDNLKLNYPSSTDLFKSYRPGFNSNGGGFYQENGANPLITINNESGVYDSKDFTNFNYNNAIKIVNLDYNYNLAVKDHTSTNPYSGKSNGSPGTIFCSENPNAGKLCLKSVTFLGKNNFNYMPPYQFQYKGEYLGPQSSYIMYPVNALVQKTNNGMSALNYSGKYISYGSGTGIPIADIRAKDEWGFLKNIPGQENEVRAAAWTMNKIITPTGSSIDFEHEEDDFDQEAFSRRYWNSNLKFKTTNLTNDILIEIQNQNGILEGLKVNFTDYFRTGERVFLDLWLARARGGNSSTSGAVDINPKTRCVVSEVGSTYVKILASKSDFPELVEYTYPQQGYYNSPTAIPARYLSERPDYVQNCFFSVSDNECGSNVYDPQKRGETPPVSNCPFNTNCPDHWTIKYKLLANKVPTARSGGGLRVKSITLNDENNHRYKTNYYYNKLGSAKDKKTAGYISSGITSYSPVRGTKFVPYQSELPSPGVMYENVTMEPQSETGETLGETRYEFYVLKPLLNIFDENLEMKDVDGTTIFKSTVNQSNTSGDYLNSAKKIKSKTIKLDINTSLIGQFKSISEFNNKGQLLSKVEKKYKSGFALKQANINRGSILESFQSMKSVFTTDSNDANPVLKNRFLSISSKEEYSSVLESITTTGPHGKNIEQYSDTDKETGAFLTVEKTMSNGIKTREERVPAYNKYPALGSKVDNINNKNMLSQTAVDYSYILDNGNWKKTGVGITTWNNEWIYQDIAASTSSPSIANQKIWRKHKTFIWNGSKDSNGIFLNYGANDDNFNWMLPNSVGIDVAQLAQWKQTSEIRLYNYFSNPLEIKDINNNFASTKMGDKDSKVIVTGNAGYNEIFFTGAENTPVSGFLEPEINMINATRNTTYFHTGKQSIAATSSSQFGVAMKSNQHRAGKYKVSVWVEKANAANARINDNGNIVNFTETYSAGNWVLKTGYVNVPVGAYSIFVTSVDNSTVYFDDLMIRPISSAITGYVYNEYDELTYIIANNGLATKYEYDPAGRLIKMHMEVLNDNFYEFGELSPYSGGFKLIKTNTYNNRFVK
jgi:YD repeat-containing protein